jgi:mannosyltransferase
VDATGGATSQIAARSSSTHSAQTNPTWCDAGVLSIIAAVAAALRFHLLATKSFWFDEGVSVAIARLDWYNFARILWRREANMSLYYFFLRLWLHFGGSEFFIRSLSVVFAVASIPVIYLLGRRLFDSRVGLFAAALLATNAYHVQYSQDARSYTLMVLLCSVSSFYFLEELREPSRFNRAAYILASVLAVYAQFFSLLLLVAQWLSLSMLDRGQIPRQTKNDWRWIVLLVAPVVVFVATTGTGPLRWVQRPGLKDFWVFASHLSGNGGALLLLGCAAACFAAVAPVWRSCRIRRAPWESWRFRFLLCWLLFPPVFTLALSLVKPLFVARYFIFCLPALLLLVACGLTRLRPNWLIAAALSLMLVLSLQGIAGYYGRDIDIQRDDWRDATKYLLSHAGPEDALLFHVPMGRMPYDFYLSVLGVPSSAALVLYPRHSDRITFLDFVEKPNDAELQHLIPQHRRAWLVLTYAETQSGQPDARTIELSKILRSIYPTVAQHDFNGIDIKTYSMK